MPLLDRTYFETNAAELLGRAGLSKARFAERMGVARQNIQKVFETKNVLTLMKAADVLGLPFITLISGDDAPVQGNADICGYLEYGGTITKVRSVGDVRRWLKAVDSNADA